MDTILTDFHRPDFDLEYEVITQITEDSTTIQKAVECCGCHPSNTSVCAVENDAAHVLGSSVGHVGTFWFM